MKPPKSELGLPKKKFSETFSAVTALRNHFNKATDYEVRTGSNKVV